ncbi:MAG: hypothetical protein J1E80_06615 [Desulfovibrionaceae bacterium]|nr:hypothetical protein [Desulfovibrionaceae bacterium]
MKTCALVAALILSLWRLDHVNGDLEAERQSHAVTAKERDGWKTAAEAAQKDATAQAENARLCLDREAQAAKHAAERAAIMRQAVPRPRTDTEKGQVVDDETRNRVAIRLNRPL